MRTAARSLPVAAAAVLVGFGAAAGAQSTGDSAHALYGAGGSSRSSLYGVNSRLRRTNIFGTSRFGGYSDMSLYRRRFQRSGGTGMLSKATRLGSLGGGSMSGMSGGGMGAMLGAMGGAGGLGGLGGGGMLGAAGMAGGAMGGLSAYDERGALSQDPFGSAGANGQSWLGGLSAIGQEMDPSAMASLGAAGGMAAARLFARTKSKAHRWSDGPGSSLYSNSREARAGADKMMASQASGFIMSREQQFVQQGPAASMVLKKLGIASALQAQSTITGYSVDSVYSHFGIRPPSPIYTDSMLYNTLNGEPAIRSSAPPRIGALGTFGEYHPAGQPDRGGRQPGP